MHCQLSHRKQLRNARWQEFPELQAANYLGPQAFTFQERPSRVLVETYELEWRQKMLSECLVSSRLYEGFVDSDTADSGDPQLGQAT